VKLHAAFLPRQYMHRAGNSAFSVGSTRQQQPIKVGRKAAVQLDFLIFGHCNEHINFNGQ
jgi:hypothetical protein